MSDAITLQNLTLSYRRHPVVHHLNGAFAAGSLTAITGPNGAGKSSLLKAIAGLIKPDQGQIIRPSENDCLLAYLPQTTHFQNNFPMTVRQMVTTGLWARTGNHRRITKDMRDQVKTAIASVGLEGLEERNITRLSAGQQQRALFARIMVMNADIILLDEPFNAMDDSTTRHLLDTIHEWHAEGKTLIAVLHDIEQIKQHFPDCLLLAREPIAWGASKQTLHPENLLKARFFKPAWSDHGDICEHAV